MKEWFDLFNHRTISLFYRSWKKYRPYANQLQGLTESEPDDFSFALQCFAGIGLPSLTRQVAQFVPSKSNAIVESQNTGEIGTVNEVENANANVNAVAEQVFSPKPEPNFRKNLSLLRYSGLLSQRPRSAANLKSLLEDYFDLDFEIEQYCGNWLSLDETAQTRLGVHRGNCTLGVDSVVGDQTWERQNKILIKVGPLTKQQFAALMPDHKSLDQSAEEKNDFQLMNDLVRLFVSPEIEFDIQLLVEGDQLPEPELSENLQSGLRLGWNTWLTEDAQADVASDAVFSECDSWL